MIPALAVDDFLARPYDDHTWLKDLNHADLDRALKALRPRIWLHPDLGLHQKTAILLGVAYPKFCLWLDMGTGKTAVALHLIQYWWDCGLMRRAIVFVTSDKAFDTWEKQFARFEITVPFVALDGSSEERWKIFNEFGDGVILVPYPGAVAMVTRLKPSKKKGKRRREFWPKLVKRFADRVDVCVWDESTRVGNPDSLAHRLGDRIKAPYRYALAGRPFGRDPTPLWAQFSMIDRGETLGQTLGLFRAVFFNEVADEWAYSGVKHVFNQKMKNELARIIRHRSISYDADECIDLPAVSKYIETLRLPMEAKAYYRKLVDMVIAAKGNFRELRNVFVRMRQVSSGFLGLKDDETGERLEVQFEDNPKLDRLLDFVDAVPGDRKAVIFYEFTHSGRCIFKNLTDELGLDAIWLWSGTVDARKSLRRFYDTPECRFSVVNNRLGAMSLDGLQVANYLFFYESPVSVIDREQAERRVVRQGQRHKVFQYDLIVQGTQDQRILDFHKEGEDIFQALMRNPNLLLG